MRFKFTKILALSFLLINLSACSLDIKPPSFSFSTYEIGPKSDKQKDNISSIETSDFAQQVELIEIKDSEELGDFLKNDLIKKADLPKKVNKETNEKYLTNDVSSSVLSTRSEDIKITNQYIYQIIGKSIFVVEAYPAVNANISSEIKLEHTPTSLFVNDESLFVFGNTDKNNAFIKIFNTSDKQNIALVNEIKIPADDFDIRFIDGFLYITTTNYFFDALFDENNMSGFVYQNKDEKNIKNVIRPSVFRFGLPYESLVMKSVYVVNLKNYETVKINHYLLPHESVVYQGERTLFISNAKVLDKKSLELKIMTDVLYDELNVSKRNRVDAISKADSLVLSKSEKYEKIKQIYEQHINSLEESMRELKKAEIQEKLSAIIDSYSAELNNSVLHRIYLGGGEIKYSGHVEINGKIKSSDLMAENEKNIILLSSSPKKPGLDTEFTENQWNFYVIDENMSIASNLLDLKLGKIDGSIYSIGTKILIPSTEARVTFSVIDIGNMNEIKAPTLLNILGDIKLLQLFDSATLITMGDNILENNQSEGIKISLYNIKDTEKPILIDSQVLGGKGSNSMAFDFSKFAMYSSEKKLLLLPISIRNSGEGIFASQDFDGLAAFAITSEGISLRGLLDDKNLKISNLKSRHINDLLYTFSGDNLKISSLKGFNIIKELSLIETK